MIAHRAPGSRQPGPLGTQLSCICAYAGERAKKSSRLHARMQVAVIHCSHPNTSGARSTWRPLGQRDAMGLDATNEPITRSVTNTKHWRLLLMLIWKNKQHLNREVLLPCRGEGFSVGYSAPFNESKREKAGRYTESQVFILFFNPYQQLPKWQKIQALYSILNTLNVQGLLVL